MRKAIRRGYCIHQTDPRLQVAEVLRRFNLTDRVKPFQRCLRCNSPLEVVSKQDIIERLEPLTKKYYDEFRICPSCKQVYWKGSHYEHMLQLIGELEDSSCSRSKEDEMKTFRTSPAMYYIAALLVFVLVCGVIRQDHRGIGIPTGRLAE